MYCITSALTCNRIEGAKFFLYTLIDPETGQIVYVGKTNNPKLRYGGHLTGARKTKRGDLFSNFPIQRWVLKYMEAGVYPEMRIVGYYMTEKEVWYAEAQKVRECFAAGLPLLNVNRPHYKKYIPSGVYISEREYYWMHRDKHDPDLIAAMFPDRIGSDV
jgi:hypothetical protein